MCIYCRKLSPDVEPSEAHIFPAALGGTEYTTDTVCRWCNGRVNREVETPVVPSFGVFRIVHGVEGRRGLPGVQAMTRVEGREKAARLGPDGALRGPIVHALRRDDGRRVFYVYGTPDMRREKMASIARKHPDIKWETEEYESPVELVIDGPPLVPLGRLAAKVAFERFAQSRRDRCLESDFDGIREFILTGAEVEPCCGVTADPILWNKSSFGPIRPPAHAVVVVLHPQDRIAGAMVMFFGMFLYWVILSRRYTAVWPVDDLLIEWPHIEWPHIGTSSEPLLRGGLGSIRVPWPQYINEYTRDPAGTMQAALRVAQERFQQALDSSPSDTP